MSSTVDRRGVGATLVAAGLAGWFVATAASQHPLRQFDRLRTYDPLGLLLPNWRFFAPEPAQHDIRLLHRVLAADGATSPWEETYSITGRRPLQMVWFPQRRRDKALFDAVSHLLTCLAIPRVNIASTYAYRLIEDAVRHRVRRSHSTGPSPRGFQFVIAEHAGYDPDVEPTYLMASQFISMTDGPANDPPAVGSTGEAVNVR
jgi:hypothetical protein